MAKITPSSSGYYFDWQTNTFYMGHRFSIKANDFNSEEYNIFDQFSARFPTMRVVVEAQKKRKSSYITYDNMARYILLQENSTELMAQFKRVTEESQCQTNPRWFVNKWFRETFPQFNKPSAKVA